MTRDSPPELAREWPGPHVSHSVTRAPRRSRLSAVQPPNAPAPTTTTWGPRCVRADVLAPAGRSPAPRAGGTAMAPGARAAAGTKAAPALSTTRREICFLSSAMCRGISGRYCGNPRLRLEPRIGAYGRETVPRHGLWPANGDHEGEISILARALQPSDRLFRLAEARVDCRNQRRRYVLLLRRRRELAEDRAGLFGATESRIDGGQ